MKKIKTTMSKTAIALMLFLLTEASWGQTFTGGTVLSKQTDRADAQNYSVFNDTTDGCYVSSSTYAIALETPEHNKDNRLGYRPITFSVTIPNYTKVKYTYYATLYINVMYASTWGTGYPYMASELFDFGDSQPNSFNLNTKNNINLSNDYSVGKQRFQGCPDKTESHERYNNNANESERISIVYELDNSTSSSSANKTKYLGLFSYNRPSLISTSSSSTQICSGVEFALQSADYTYYNKLRYDLNGGSGAITESDFAVSNTVTSAIPIRAGYAFVGWKLNGVTFSSGSNITATSSVKGPLTLVAQWEKIYTPDTESGDNKGKITFSNKKDVTPDDVSVAMNETTNIKTVVDMSASNVKAGDVAGVISNIKNNNRAGSNIIIYMKEGISIPDGITNVIVGEACLNFVVTDKQPVHITKAFTANTANYTRSLSASTTNKLWGTICLPYAVSSDDNIQYYCFAGISGNTIRFSKVDAVAANTPAAFCTSASINATKENETIPVTADLTQTASGYEFTGIQSEAVTLPVGSDCYYIAQNKFWSPTKNAVTVAPQRAYFKASDTPASSSAKLTSLGIVEWEDTTTTITDTFSDDTRTAKYYDISGKPHNSPQPGLNIVRLANGKTIKVMIER